MNILVFGDSIAWGAFDYLHGGWANRLKTELFPHHFVYNLAVSGTTSENILKSIEREAFPRADVDNLIIIAIGINDSSKRNGKYEVEIEKFKSNILEIIDKALKISSRVILVGLTNVIEELASPVSWDEELCYSNMDIWNYNKVLVDITRSQYPKVEYVDMRDKIQPYQITDGVHPNGTAHDIIKKEVLGIINKYIK